MSINAMSDQNMKPPFFIRTLMEISRCVPPFRGRSRIFAIFHRYLSGRGWNDKIIINGYHINLLLDDLISRTIYIEGAFDPASTEALSKLIHPGTVVFDVGANMGYYTLLFAQLVGQSGHVYAFEPVPATAGRLNDNLKSNYILKDRVTVFAIALSDKDSIVEINVASNINTGASHVVTLSKADDQGRIQARVIDVIPATCRRCDSIWKDIGKPEICLIKIDVEGHEFFTLKGMEEILTNNKTLTVMIEVRSSYLKAAGASKEVLFDFMKKCDFMSYDYDLKRKKYIVNNMPRDGELIIFTKINLGMKET